jgi:hypothetical protein
MQEVTGSIPVSPKSRNDLSARDIHLANQSQDIQGAGAPVEEEAMLLALRHN